MITNYSNNVSKEQEKKKQDNLFEKTNVPAPDLFPPYSHIVNSESCTKLGNHDLLESEHEEEMMTRQLKETDSVSSSQFKIFFDKKLPKSYKQDIVNDKFYLSKVMGQSPIYYDDFVSYEQAVTKEDYLRRKLKALELQETAHLTSQKTRNVVCNESSNVYSEYDEPGQEIAIVHNIDDLFQTDLVDKSEQRTGLARKIYERLQPSSTILHKRDKVSTTTDKTATPDLKENYQLYDLRSQPFTEVIGDPEYGYIETRMEKKYNEDIIITEQDSNSYLPRRSVDYSRHHNKLNPVSKNFLQRKLAMRHLQMISLGATIGIGIFLNCGRTFSIAGPLGAFLGFLISSTIIVGTLLCFAEIIAVIPLNVGISGLISRFISDAVGFSVSWCYLFSYIISIPAELLASILLMSYYEKFDAVIKDNYKLGLIIVGMVVAVTFVNLLDVRVYAEIEYVASTFKVLVVSAMIITMIVINCGVSGKGVNDGYIGFKYWDSKKSPNKDITFGPFRPTFNLNDLGKESNGGIGGFGGIVLSIMASVSVSVYSYIGSELGFIAAGESKVSFRRSIPSVTKRIFIRVIVLYLLSIFLLGLNIYSGDPRLLRYSTNQPTYDQIYENYESIVDELGGGYCTANLHTGIVFTESANQSPWMIALTSLNMCGISAVFDGFFACIGIFAATSQLYAASRILYSMAIQEKAPKIFQICNSHGVPYVSVLCCGSFGLLTLLCLHMETSNALVNLVEIGTQGSIIMWFAMNLAFYRFFQALKNRPDIISRQSKEYPYKSPFQPYLSIYGMITTFLLLIINGFQTFIKWNTTNFIVSYCILLIFVILFVGFCIFKNPSFQKIEELDLDTGRRELDREIWVENRDYLPTVKELITKVLSYI